MRKTSTAVLDRLLEPIRRCLTPAVARKLIKLKADPETQAHMEMLARKSSAGKLTPVERAEYETLVGAGTFIAILQAKARAIVNRNGD